MLAFAPFGYWWILIPAMVFLFVVCQSASSRQAFQIGWCFGLAYFGLGVSWVFNSLYDYGNAPLAVAALLTIVMVVYLSMFPALTAWLYVRLCPPAERTSLLGALLFVASWILFEWIRGWLLSGFTWLSVGHALPTSPLSGWIPVSGSLGAGLVLALYAVSLAVLIQNRARISTLALLAVISLITWGLYSIEWVRPINRDPLQVTLVQGNVDHDLKWDRSRRSEVFSRYIRLTLAHPDSDIVLWPETAIPTYYRNVTTNLLPQLYSLMNEIDAELVTGIFAYEDEKQEIHNSLLVIGENEQFYHKRHLVPFGEFLPFRWLFNFMQNFIQIPMSDLSPGEGPPLLHVKGVVLGPSICYEAIFSGQIASSLPDAQILLNVTNDAWFGDSWAPHQHLQIAQSRSLETGRWMMRAANNGISAFIDHRGHIVAQTPQFIATTLQHSVVAMQGTTPFALWKNYLAVILCALILIIMPLFCRQRRTGEEP